MVPLRRVVYEGQTRLGYKVIYEGDFVAFDHPINADWSQRGIAHYSTRHTIHAQRRGRIGYRQDGYSYDPEDQHDFHWDSLSVHTPSVPQERKRTGFGNFIQSIEDRHHEPTLLA